MPQRLQPDAPSAKKHCPQTKGMYFIRMYSYISTGFQHFHWIKIKYLSVRGSGFESVSTKGRKHVGLQYREKVWIINYKVKLKSPAEDDEKRQAVRRPAVTVIIIVFIKYQQNHRYFYWLEAKKNLKLILQRLATGRSGDRKPVGTRIFAPVQTDPGDHQASYTMGTGSFPGVKRLGRGVNHPPTSSVEVKERVDLYFQSLLGLTVCYMMNFTFIFTPGRPRRRGSG